MEQRVFKRFRRRLPIYYRRLDQEGYTKSESKDVSEGGLRLVLKNPESIERVLQCKLLMPLGHDIVDFLGKVTWLKKGAPECEAGIEVMDLGTDYGDRIRTLFRE